MVISLSVVANEHVPPEGVDAKGADNNVRVVQLMVVCNPCADHSPHGLPGWISTESGNLLCFSSYTVMKIR